MKGVQLKHCCQWVSQSRLMKEESLYCVSKSFGNSLFTIPSIRVNRHTSKWCEAMNIQKGNQDIGLFIVNGVLFCNANNGIDVTNKNGDTGVKLSSEIIQKFDFCQLSKQFII